MSIERDLKSYWTSRRDDSIRAGRHQRAFRELRRRNSATAISAKRLQTRRKLKSEDKFQTCLSSIKRPHSSFMISEKISTGSFENGHWRHELTKSVNESIVFSIVCSVSSYVRKGIARSIGTLVFLGDWCMRTTAGRKYRD